MTKKKNKDLDLNLGTEFEDFESGFDDFDFGDSVDTNTSSNRTPAEKVRQGLSSGIKTTATSIGPKLASRLGHKLPNTASLASEAMRFGSEAQALRTQFVKDVMPHMQQLKNAARIILPKQSKYIPKKIQDKLDKLLAPAEQYKSPSVAESRDTAIEESLGIIFAAQEKREQAKLDEERTEKFVQKTTETLRHKETSSILDSIRVATEFQRNFTETIGTAYLKKSLELKYRHLFVAQDTLSTVEAISKIVETKLEQIRHNTALPDIQKQKLSESYKDVMRQAVSQRLNASVTGWGSKILKNVKDKVLDPFTEGLSMAASGADMYASMSEAMEGMGVGKQSGAQRIGGIAGSLLAGQLAKMGANKLFGTYDQRGILSPYGNNIEDMTKQLKLRAMLKVKDLEDTVDPSSPMGFLVSLLSPGISRGAGQVSNLDALKPTEPVSYDRAARTSLVEIIPGYLAKILQQTTRIATGSDAEELTYDFDSRDFVSTSTFQQKILDKAFGTREDRGREIGAAVGTLRGIYAHIGEDVFTFDQATDKIEKVLVNAASRKRLIDANIIRKFVNDDDLSEKEEMYITDIFKGITDKRTVAQVLDTALHRDYDTVNQQAVTTINSHIIHLMGKDEYLDILPKYLLETGQGRHLKSILKTTESSFAFDREAINDLRLSGDRTAYAESVTDFSRRTKAQLDQDVTDKLATPETARKFLEPIFGKAATTAIIEGMPDDFVYNKEQSSGRVRKKKKPQAGMAVARIDGTSSATLLDVDDFVTPINLVDTEIVLPVHLKKSDIDFGPKQVEPQVQTTKIESDTLDGILKSHAERQYPVPDILERIAGSTTEINDKLLSLLVQVGSFFGNLYHKGKAFTRNSLDRLSRLKTTITENVVGYAKDTAYGMYDRALGAGRYLGEKWNQLNNSDLFGGIRGAASTAMGAGLTAIDYTKGLAQGAMGRLAGAWADKFQSARDNFGSWKDRMKGRFASSMEGVKSMAKMHWRFVDVYRKDEVDVGNPLLSKKDQEKGVVFSNNKPVITSYNITLPVMDPETQATLITKEDIEHGLVDVNNKPLKSSSTIGGLIRKGVNKLFGLGNLSGMVDKIKDIFSSKNPLVQLFSKIAGVGVDLFGMFGKSANRMFNRLFGLDKTEITKKDLQGIVGDKLDLIYEYLRFRFGEHPDRGEDSGPKGPHAGDLDGDGDDTPFERYLRNKKEKQEKKKEKREEQNTELLEDIKNSLYTQEDIAKKTYKEQKKEDSGILGKLLGMLGLGGGGAAGASGGWLGKLKGLGTKVLAGAGGLFAGKAALGAVGAGGAATAAATGSATAVAGATGASTAAVASGTAAGGITAALASNPVGWIAAGVIAVGAGTYLGYKWLNPSGDDILSTRADLYGVKLDTSTGIFSESFTKKILALEEETAKIIGGENNPLNNRQIENWAERFGFDNKKVEETRYWATWYRQRFYPVFNIYLDLLSKVGHTYESSDDLDSETAKSLSKELLNQASGHVMKLKELVPTKEGFARFSKALTQVKTENLDPTKSRDIRKEFEEYDPESKAANVLTKKSDKYRPTITENVATKRMSSSEFGPPSTQGMTFPTGVSSGGQVLDYTGVEKPVDISGYKPRTPSDKLGMLSAEFESGKHGSAAVGYDPVGGTSYGKYQIASRPGTFRSFLEWVKTQGAIGKEVFQRLVNSGPENTGGTNGTTPNEWRRLAVEGKIDILEHEYIKQTHFGKALNQLSEALKAKVSASMTLKDVLWSTAVQHGPAGAVRIFVKAWEAFNNDPQVDEKQLVKQIYQIRKTQFKSSPSNIQQSVSRRFDKENAIAQLELSREKNTGTDRTTSETGIDPSSTKPSVLMINGRVATEQERAHHEEKMAWRKEEHQKYRTNLNKSLISHGYDPINTGMDQQSSGLVQTSTTHTKPDVQPQTKKQIEQESTQKLTAVYDVVSKPIVDELTRITEVLMTISEQLGTMNSETNANLKEVSGKLKDGFGTLTKSTDMVQKNIIKQQPVYSGQSAMNVSRQKALSRV